MSEPYADTVQIFVPLKIRKRNGRPKILPPADIPLTDAPNQDPHILRAIGQAWAWRRKLEDGEFATAKDLAAAIGKNERFVARQLKLAYLAPAVLRRLLVEREGPAITIREMTDVAALPWERQEAAMFKT